MTGIEFPDEFEEPEPEPIGWNEALFDGRVNPAIPFFKKALKFVFLYAPDTSYLFGASRILVNVLFAFFAVGVFMLVNDFSAFGLLLSFTIIGVFAFLLYSKMVAYSCLKGIENWERLGKAKFK